MVTALCIMFSAAANPFPATADTPEAKLSALGFHVFKTPQALPAVTVTPLNASEGPTLAVDKLAGSITVLNFWATWCPPCRKEMPSIQRLGELMKGTSFRIVAVSVGEDKTAVASFIKKNGYTYPIYLDERGTVGGALASQGIPTTYILDKTGKAIAGTVGSREFDDPAIVAVLKELAAR